MKGLIKDRKSAIVCMAVAAVLCCILMFFPGFAGDRQTVGRTVAYGSIKYGTDISALDKDALAEEIRNATGLKCDVGITTNFSTGYDNIVIEYGEPADIDTAALKTLFDASHSDLGIEEFFSYKLNAERTKASVWTELAFILCSFCVCVAVYALLTGRKLRFILTVGAVSLISALVSMALVLVARIPFGRMTAVTLTTALLTAALASCWQINNYSVLSGGRKKKTGKDTADRAENLGWTVTFEAAVFSILAICGLFAGCLITGRTGMFSLALCTALPVIVSAFAAQFFAIKLYA